MCAMTLNLIDVSGVSLVPKLISSNVCLIMVSFVLMGYWCVTDRQTNIHRQTDRKPITLLHSAWHCYTARVAPSGECLWGKGLVWLIGPVMYLLAAFVGPIAR